MSISRIFSIFDEANVASGNNNKTEIISNLVQEMKDFPVLEEMVRFTYDPFINFYTTPSAEPPFEGSLSDEDLEIIWDETRSILKAMSTRTLAGNDAKIRMQSILKRLPETSQKYFYGIFNRDLPIASVGRTIWSQFYKGLKADAKPQLCEKYTGDMSLKFPVYVEPKFDGYRCVIVVNAEGACTGLSRNLKPFFNWEVISDAITKAGIRNMVVDGEFLSSVGDTPEDKFHITGSIVTTQKRRHEHSDTLQFHVFDAMPIDEWISGKGVLTIEARHELVKAVVGEVGNPLFVVHREIVHDMNGLMDWYDRFVDSGYEGIIIKTVGSVYQFKKNKVWLKMKPEIEGDFEIIGVENGDADGWACDTLGRIIVRGVVDGKKIITNCGSGFKQAQRDELWALHKGAGLIGKIVEMNFQGVDAEVGNTSQEVFALRFPVFKRMRPDKTTIEN